MQDPLPLIRDLVFLGGGHTHALVLRKWAMAPLAGIRVTLINPGPTAPYTGMLPGHIAGHYGRAALEMDLVQLARFADARLVLGRAEAIDRDARAVRLEGGRRVPYDLLSVDIGITSDMPEIPGFAEHGVAAKPLGGFAERWEAYVPRVAAGERPATAAVIGGGIAGVELAFAMRHRLTGATGGPAQVHLIEAAEPLADSTPKLRYALLTALAERGIAVHAGRRVTEVTRDTVLLDDGSELDGAFCIGAAGARPQDWLAGTGLDLTDGYITVDAQLRSTNDPAVYATGDCAHQSTAPRPKAGVFAVRAAPVLYHNLCADLTGRARRAFRPQRHYLKLISLGSRAAIAERGPLSLTMPALRPALWRWKDRIDVAFMDRFHTLPKMVPPPLKEPVATGLRDELAGSKPLCGGCGAKVGGGALRAALEDLPDTEREDLERLPGDDAALLSMGGTRQVLTTDHLRAVVEDPWLMARIAAHHAMGDIWSMGARPQVALASVILPRLSTDLQARWMDEIMGAASEIFAAEGAAIAGGHSTMGRELTLGFTVTGLLDGPAITLAGARAGDALILTRPVGSGTLLAAEMAGEADGRDMATLYDQMTQSLAPAARLLAEHASAMTDVTGFGLLGHALGIARASGVGVEIETDAVPLYPGALALAETGTRSSLFATNLGDALPMLEGWKDSATRALLLDPQTCGGLLAALPEADIAALDKRALPYWRIGTIVEGAPVIRLR